MNNKLRECLAEYAHNAWSGWMEYMFSKCQEVDVGIFVPAQAYERWSRQKNTAYADLPESEKNSDREEADKIIRIIDAPCLVCGQILNNFHSGEHPCAECGQPMVWDEVI